MVLLMLNYCVNKKEVNKLDIIFMTQKNEKRFIIHLLESIKAVSFQKGFIFSSYSFQKQEVGKIKREGEDNLFLVNELFDEFMDCINDDKFKAFIKKHKNFLFDNAGIQLSGLVEVFKKQEIKIPEGWKSGMA